MTRTHGQDHLRTLLFPSVRSSESVGSCCPRGSLKIRIRVANSISADGRSDDVVEIRQMNVVLVPSLEQIAQRKGCKIDRADET
jgi:hypothetical protein